MCAYIGQKCVWGPVWAAAQLQLVWTTAWKLRKTDWLSFFSPLSTSSSLPASHTNWWVGGPATRVRESYNKTDGHIHNAAAPTRPFFFFLGSSYINPFASFFLARRKARLTYLRLKWSPTTTAITSERETFSRVKSETEFFFFCMSYKLFFTI